MPQITLVALFDDGGHLVCSNDGEPWGLFQIKARKAVLRYICISPKHHVKAVATALAHHDHFHLIEGHQELVKLLGLPALPGYEVLDA